MARRAYEISDNYFNTIDSEDKSYWLGFLYADGWVSEGSNEIGIELQSLDRRQLEDFKQALELKGREVVAKERPSMSSGSSVVLTFSSKVMKQDLINNGCPPKKSLILTFPNKEIVPDKYLYSFIRGYMDGDGCISTWKNGKYDRYELSFAGTEEFLSGLLNRTGWVKNKIVIKKDCNIRELKFSSKKKVIEYLSLLYSQGTQRLNRKYEKYLDILDKEAK